MASVNLNRVDRAAKRASKALATFNKARAALEAANTELDRAVDEHQVAIVELQDNVDRAVADRKANDRVISKLNELLG